MDILSQPTEERDAVPHSSADKARLLAIVALEAEHQYYGSNEYRASCPWSLLDDLAQQAWSMKACSALEITPETWRSAVEACRIPGQSVKQLLAEIRWGYTEKAERPE